MTSPCDVCANQVVKDGQAQCGLNSQCALDPGSRVLFAPRTRDEISVRNQAARILRQDEQISQLRHTVDVLQSRLIKVEDLG